MTAALALSRALHANQRQAEHDHRPALERAYQAALEHIARDATTSFQAITAAAWQPPPEGQILTPSQLATIAATLNQRLAPAWRTILTQIAQAPLARLGIAWDVTHPLAAGLLQQASNRTGRQLGAAVQPILRATVADAYDKGLSIPDTAANIRAALTEAAPWQAEMLARTDLTTLANGSSHAAAKLIGLEYKTWLATLDDRTRETHAEADGQTVPIDAQFTVGGEQADYPGDPTLSDEEAINCRCTLVYADSLTASADLLTGGSGRILAGMATTKQRARKLSRRRAAGATGDWQSQAWKDERRPGLTAAAIPAKSTPVVDATWDGNAAMGRCSSQADFRSICAWVDSTGDPGERQSYKFPHHANPGGPANIAGVRNALSRLPQAQIPTGDVAGVKAHLQRHMDDYQAKQGKGAALAAMPSGMDSLPAGVKACSMNGKPGYTGGRLCYTHDGTDAGMRKAISNAQRDAGKKSGTSLTAASAPGAIPFDGTAAIEGKVSDDNTLTPRVLMPDSLAWPELPVSFMAQTVTAEGHDGAEVAGRVDTLARKRGAGKMRNIAVAGELTTPFGISEIAPMIEDKTMRYVSVDLGASEWALVDRKSLTVVPDDEFDLATATEGGYALGLTAGKVKALTLVATQAIEGAMVALTASADVAGVGIADLGDGETRVVLPLEEFALAPEAIVASAAPAKPPRAWFETAEPPGKMPLTITAEGRVFGHLACWDSCHMSFLPACIPPPRSPSNYAYFHVGELETAEGERVAVGKLMVGGRHDSNLSHSREEAMRHYDDSSRVGALLRATDGKYGIWVCGALAASASEALVADMKLHPPSGDWRPVNGRHELICGLSVPVPGFATPRAEMTLIASGDEVEMGALVASLGPAEADAAAVAALTASGLLLSAEEQEAERRIRVLAARAQGIDALAALATDTSRPARSSRPARRRSSYEHMRRSTPPPEPAEPALADEPLAPAEGDDLDERVSAALGTLAHVTGMASRVQAAEQQAAEMAALVESAREEHRQETLEQKQETLAAIEAMTAQIAAGGEISQAMLAAMSQLAERKPRSVKVVRDENGRAVAYEEAV